MSAKPRFGCYLKEGKEPKVRQKRCQVCTLNILTHQAVLGQLKPSILAMFGLSQPSTPSFFLGQKGRFCLDLNYLIR